MSLAKVQLMSLVDSCSSVSLVVLASGIPLIPVHVVFCAGRARCRWLGMEFLLRTLAAGIVLTEYFPAVDDGVVGPTLPSCSVRIARALRFPSSVMCSGCG
jgi:hypothetical protein